jgi:hypothetical protein
MMAHSIAAMPAAPDAADFVRVAADRTRLAVLGRLARSPATAAEVVATTGLAEAQVRRALGRLAAAGLVGEEAGVFRLDEAALREVAASVSRMEPPHPAVMAGLSEEEATVVGRFFRGSRLVEIPAAESKRRAVLRVLVDEFEPGRYYAEAEVRRILERFHPDHAALRRHLVEEGMLVRQNLSRTYWRGGGPPPDGGAVDPPTG